MTSLFVVCAVSTTSFPVRWPFRDYAGTRDKPTDVTGKPRQRCDFLRAQGSRRPERHVRRSWTIAPGGEGESDDVPAIPETRGRSASAERRDDHSTAAAATNRRLHIPAPLSLHDR